MIMVSISTLPHMAVVLVTVMVALLSYQVAPGDACSCMLTHPQENYCKADWAIKAKVKTSRDIQIPSANHDGVKYQRNLVLYGVKISKVFKAGRHWFKNGDYVKLYSVKGGYACGAHLYVNVTYYIQGSSGGALPTFGLCDSPTKWLKISPVTRMGYSYLYKNNCQCKGSGTTDCTYDNNFTWDQKQCYMQNAVCVSVPEGNEIEASQSNKNRRCKWSRRGVFYRCMKNTKKGGSSSSWEP